MKLHPRITTALEQAGLPWKIEPAQGHFKLRLDGRLIGVLTGGSKEASQRQVQNTVAQIRRFTRS